MSQPTTGQPGKRLLVTLLGDIAASCPQQRLGIVPNGLDVREGFHDVTAKELADAVNETSWWIEKRIGKGNGEETVAYMGSNDMRYLLFILASHKTGYKVGC